MVFTFGWGHTSLSFINLFCYSVFFPFGRRRGHMPPCPPRPATDDTSACAHTCVYLLDSTMYVIAKQLEKSLLPIDCIKLILSIVVLVTVVQVKSLMSRHRIFEVNIKFECSQWSLDFKLSPKIGKRIRIIL